MELFLKSLQNFRRELWIQRIDLARFSGRKMNDQEGYDGDEKKSDDFLDSATADK